MNDFKTSVSLCLCGLFVGCAFGRLTPGLTKDGAALAVTAASAEEARREAALASLDLFVPPGSASAPKAARLLRERAEEFAGRSRFKSGKAVVEIKFAKLLSALDAEGLLRPQGVFSQEPRVMIFVDEPERVLDLGVGPAADGLRRGLSAYGLTAIDGRDSLNDVRLSGSGEAQLRSAAARAGAQWVLVAAAEASAELDAASASWRARASLTVDAYEVERSTPVDQVRLDASAVDVSSAAARGKAFEQAAEEASARLAGVMTRSAQGRSEAALFVMGDCDLPRLKTLLSVLRETEGVAGAFLGTWRGEEGSMVVRVFLKGIKADGLAARLLRRDPTLTLLSVEPDAGRLAIEIPGGGAR